MKSSQSQNYGDWSECLGISVLLRVYTITEHNMCIYISSFKTQVHSGDSFRYIPVFNDMGLLLCNKIMFSDLGEKFFFFLCLEI